MAEIELSELLKYKTIVELKGKTGTTVKKVWLRILGDDDLQRAYKAARLASARRRAALRDPKSEDYQADIAPISEVNTREECIGVVKSTRVSEFIGEAYANINRDDLIKIEDVAVEPDSPTLEEMEQLDAQNAEQEEEFQTKIREYIDEKLKALESELSLLSDEALFERTKLEMSNILASNEFGTEVLAQKIFRGTYRDENCKVRAFKEIEDFKNAESTIKQQLLEAYSTLELTPEEIKN